MSLPLDEAYAHLWPMERPLLTQLERVAHVTAWLGEHGRFLQVERGGQVAQSAPAATFTYEQVTELLAVVTPWLRGLGEGAYLN